MVRFWDINTFKKNKKTQMPTPREIWQKPSYFVAFGFGAGCIPVAPGTFGTLMAIPFYLMMQSLSLTIYLTLLILITIGSVWLSQKVSEEIQVHDHPGMCLDEIVGFLVTMCGAPFGIGWIILGFILFRFFDILKPWPINYIDQKVSGGFGMILDDIVAGIFSLIILQIIAWIL